MTDQGIPRYEFNSLLPLHFILLSLMEEQVEWFCNRSGTLLGMIAKCEGVAAWNCAIVKRD